MLRPESTTPAVLSVKQVNDLAKATLAKLHGDVWVEGEITSLKQGSHWYFSLTDRETGETLSAVMYRSDTLTVRFTLNEGQRVKVRGGLTIFGPQSRFQIQARVITLSGAGELREELRRLYRKLLAEGLFAPEKKRPLPKVISRIGLVTSNKGAALHDVLSVIWQRRAIEVLFSEAMVQGPEAPDTIIAALLRLYERNDLDAILLVRGGGASEDLGAFNDERVVRCVARSPLPVVVGVGHEIDRSLAEFAADVRAATPSQAAVLAILPTDVLLQEIGTLRHKLERSIETELARKQNRLQRAERAILRLSPAAHMTELWRQANTALGSHMLNAIARRKTKLMLLEQQLAALDPRKRVDVQHLSLTRLSARLELAVKAQLGHAERRLTNAAPKLHGGVTAHQSHALRRLSELGRALSALSPLNVLERGYSIVRTTGSDSKDNDVVRGPDQLVIGQTLEVVAQKGKYRVKVDKDP